MIENKEQQHDKIPENEKKQIRRLANLLARTVMYAFSEEDAIDQRRVKLRSSAIEREIEPHETLMIVLLLCAAVGVCGFNSSILLQFLHVSTDACCVCA